MDLDVAPVLLAEQPGIKAKDGEALSRALAGHLVQTLKELSSGEWEAVTACAPWTVKDIAAHLLGWCDALCSPREMTTQFRLALRRRRRFANLLDAQNDAQIELYRALSTDELVAHLDEMTLKAARLRRRLGGPLHYVPAYAGFLGGASNVGYLLNAIFPRDLYVHRLDIAEATGREPNLGADRRVAVDMLRDWARRTGADARLELSGPAGGVFVAGTGTRATIATDTAGLIWRLAGRKQTSDLRIEGDREAAEGWLAAGCPV